MVSTSCTRHLFDALPLPCPSLDEACKNCVLESFAGRFTLPGVTSLLYRVSTFIKLADFLMHIRTLYVRLVASKSRDYPHSVVCLLLLQKDFLL